MNCDLVERHVFFRQPAYFHMYVLFLGIKIEPAAYVVAATLIQVERMAAHQNLTQT